MNARRDVGELLANQLDAIEADMAARAKPYADNIELRRRVNVAAAFVADMPCRCVPVLGLPEHCERQFIVCDKHRLETILAGDE